jgi:hypothetical protein
MGEEHIRAFMEPQWFLLLFAVMWIGMTGLLSRVGGWSSLAAHFGAAQPANGERFPFG